METTTLRTALETAFPGIFTVSEGVYDGEDWKGERTGPQDGVFILLTNPNMPRASATVMKMHTWLMNYTLDCVGEPATTHSVSGARYEDLGLHMPYEQ